MMKLWKLLSFLPVLVALATASTASAGPFSKKGKNALVKKEISVSNSIRTYHTFTPQRLATTTKAPLVIVLHGGGGNGSNAAQMTGFNKLAAKAGFIVAYPDGSARGKRFFTWNAGHCCAYAMENNIDDVLFISNMIDELIDNANVDPSRVYVTGMSNGAMMSHRLGRELPRKIAAIAPVVGATFGDEMSPEVPVSTLIINGALDKNVPPAGGYGEHVGRNKPADLPYMPAIDQLEFWRNANECTSPARTSETDIYFLTSHTNCKSDMEVFFYMLKEGGHAWPGGTKGWKGGDTPIQTFEATDIIWAFFQRHQNSTND